MGEILAKLLAQRRQGGGQADPAQMAGGMAAGGMPQMDAMMGGGMGQDPMAAMMQPGAQPQPQGDQSLQQMLQFLQQHSGLLSMLRNRRNQGMNAVQGMDQ